MKKLIVLVAAVLALGALAFGQARAANEPVAKLNTQEWRMQMSPTTIQVGVPVKLEATNNGTIAHEVVFEKAGEVDEALTTDDEGKEVAAEIENIAPGETKSLEWTFTEPGTYWAACHIKDHFEAGMKTEFTVVAQSALPFSFGSLDATGLGIIVVGAFVLIFGGLGAWKLGKR
jgi:plastocyanin